jgi:arylsulfatase A-like enzyme
MDEQLGRLFGLLKERNLYDSSLIVFTSDHGESLGENGIYYDHWGLSDVNYRVPLIFKFPDGQHRSMRIDALVQGIDIFPTVLDIVGYQVSNWYDGLSLMPLVLGEKESVREEIFMETTMSSAAVIRTEEWKFAIPLKIRLHHKNVNELYDLKNDPGELNNLAAIEREMTEDLGRRLIRWLREKKVETFEVTLDNDPETQRRLRSLGY